MSATGLVGSSKEKEKEKEAERDRRFTKHGYPRGFRFVPKRLELITILSDRIHGRPLHPKVAAIFHGLSILDHHPQELHDDYKRYAEHRYIYFFSLREFQKPPAAGGGGGASSSSAHRKRRQRGGRAAAGGRRQVDEDYYGKNGPRPVRLAKGGGWKPSGGGHELRWPKRKGGYVAGKMVTMVFYDHHDKEQVKSEWGMHEFTVPVDTRMRSKLTRTTRLHDMALYRIYKLKSDDLETGSDDEDAAAAAAGSKSNSHTTTLVSAADDDGHHHFLAPAAAGQQPSLGNSFVTGRGRNHQSSLAAAGPSTSRSSSRMPPPPPPQQQQQQHMPSHVGHAPPYYQNDHQYGLGGAAAPAISAGHQQQQVHTMTMPPAYGSGMMPMPGRHQMFQCARPPAGTVGLPAAGRQMLPFARPPAPGTPNFFPGRQVFQLATPPPQMPVPPPAATNPACAAGKQTGGLSLPSAPVSSSTPPPPPPAAESTPEAANNNATAEEAAGQHVVQSEDVCVKAPEESVPPLPVPPPIPTEEDAAVPADDSYNWDFDISEMLDERFQFSLEELCLPSLDDDDDEPPPTPGGGDNNNCSMELGTCTL